MNRRRSHRPDRPPQPGRRSPPPESTGFESRYLNQCSEGQAAVRVHLLDGGSVEGTLLEFDREVLVLKPAIGDAITVRKAGIRFIEEPG